jgi:pimeloyl-ACP methyl ester carboxylesterase
MYQEKLTENFQHNEHHFNPTSGRNDTVILLVHGWESNASRWEKYTLFTKIRNTIIAIDALHMVCLVARNLTFLYAEFIHVLFQNSN